MKASPFLSVVVLGSHPRHFELVHWFSVHCHLPTHAHTRAQECDAIHVHPLHHIALMCFLPAALYSYTLKSPHSTGMRSLHSWTLLPLTEQMGQSWQASREKTTKKHKPHVHRSCAVANKTFTCFCGCEHILKITVKQGVIAKSFVQQAKKTVEYLNVFLTVEIVR